MSKSKKLPAIQMRMPAAAQDKHGPLGQHESVDGEISRKIAFRLPADISIALREAAAHRDIYVSDMLTEILGDHFRINYRINRRRAKRFGTKFRETAALVEAVGKNELALSPEQQVDLEGFVQRFERSREL